ncbi:hypothetical protein N9L68_03020 [bacterium]|nr:hypothetical protein [bacterium]
MGMTQYDHDEEVAYKMVMTQYVDDDDEDVDDEVACKICISPFNGVDGDDDAP